MKGSTLSVLSLGLVLVASGCIMRSTEDYQKDTRALVDTKTTAIKDCLDGAVMGDTLMCDKYGTTKMACAGC